MNMKATLVVCCLAMLLFCGQKSVTKQEPPKPSTALPVITGFTLQSPAFPNSGPIPDMYTGKGENVSPGLSWFNPPTGTESFALVVDDPDAPGGTFTHWIACNVSKGVSSVPERVGRSDVLPGGGRQGTNSVGKIGYDGPMPPPGKIHHYLFTLYALDRMLDVTDPSKKVLLAAMEGHVLGKAVLTGTYKQ